MISLARGRGEGEVARSRGKKDVRLRAGVSPVAAHDDVDDSRPGSENRTRFFGFEGDFAGSPEASWNSESPGTSIAGGGSAKAELLLLLRRTAIGRLSTRLDSSTLTAAVCAIVDVV